MTISSLEKRLREEYGECMCPPLSEILPEVRKRVDEIQEIFEVGWGLKLHAVAGFDGSCGLYKPVLISWDEVYIDVRANLEVGVIYSVDENSNILHQSSTFDSSTSTSTILEFVEPFLRKHGVFK